MTSVMPALMDVVRRLAAEPLSARGDGELLERFVARRDERAFEALLERHGPMVLGVCRRAIGDAHLADDVFQATFLVLARRADAVRRRDGVASFLHGVALRLARKALRAEIARSRREAVAAQRRAASDDARLTAALLRLDEELGRLPDHYRDPLLLCYLQGRTQDEAAAQLGWSLSTLRRRLGHGRDALRRRLTGAAVVPLLGSLRKATLATVLADAQGAAVSASVLALVDAGLIVSASKLLSLCVLVALVALAAVMQVPSKVAPPPVAVKAKPAADLPGGAVARIGTLAFRHGAAWMYPTLNYTPDGKQLVSAGSGWVRRWDAATGAALATVGDGGRGSRITSVVLATADGRSAHVIEADVKSDGRMGYWPSKQYDMVTGKEVDERRVEFPRVVTSDNYGLAVGPPSGLSPDGKFLVSATDRGLVVYDAATGGFLHFHETKRTAKTGYGHTTFAFDPAGNGIVMAEEGRRFRLFDLKTGRERKAFEVEAKESIGRFAVSPDGKWLAGAGAVEGGTEGQVLRLFDLHRGAIVRSIDVSAGSARVAGGWIESLLFTPDGRTVLVGAGGVRGQRDCSVRCWDVATGKPGRAWADEPSLGSTLAVRPDGKVLATMNEGGVIRQWDMRTGKEINPLGNAAPVEAVAFRPGGSVLTAGRDLSLSETDIATGRVLRRFGPFGPGSHPRFSPSGTYLFAEGYDVAKGKGRDWVRAWKVADGKPAIDRDGRSAVFSGDEKLLAFADAREKVHVLDRKTQEIIRTLSLSETKGNWFGARPGPLAFLEGGRKLVTVGDEVSVWDLGTGKRVSSWNVFDKNVLKKDTRPRNNRDRIVSVATSADGARIAFGLHTDRKGVDKLRDKTGLVMVFETGGELLREIDLGAEYPKSLAFSPDGRRLACGGRWVTHVWDLGSGKATHEFEGHRGMVNALSFSADGKRLATGSEDSTVLIWDVSK
jgi:RNA polymerase sigma factor (sigma-70 family)